MARVYTGGTFDLLHKGHLELLQACHLMAGTDGKVTVALNRDEFVTKFKGEPPFQSYADRETMLLGCKYVDRVIPNVGDEVSRLTMEGQVFPGTQYPGSGPNPVPFDIVAIGTDWACRDYYGQMGFTKEWLDFNGIVLVYVDRRTGESTTAIKERLRAE